MLNQITKMRLPSGVEVALVDWTDRPLYSTADFQTGFTDEETNLFNYLIGDRVTARSTAATIVPRTATLDDTNITTISAMASTEEMLIYAIKVEMFQYDLAVSGDFTNISAMGTNIPYPNMPLTSVKELQRRMMLQLFISQKMYAEASLGYFNPGFGVFGLATAPVNPATVVMANPGWPSQEAVRSFVIPHHIGGQEKYRINLNNPTATPLNFAFNEEVPGDTSDAARIRVYLDGLYKRPTS